MDGDELHRWVMEEWLKHYDPDYLEKEHRSSHETSDIVYIHTYIHTQTYIHTHTQTYIHTYI